MENSVTLSRPEDVSQLLQNMKDYNLYDAPECTVCLFRIEKDLCVTKCGHLYHKECIGNLIKKSEPLTCAKVGCATKLEPDQPFVSLKPYAKKTDTKELLTAEVKGRVSFALTKSVYSNLKFVCGICLLNIFESELSITNCHHLFHTDCQKKVVKNGELFWCPDCDEQMPTSSKPLIFPTKEIYSKKLPMSLQKYDSFAKNYQQEIAKFKNEFSMQEHQFIEIKSEMVTAQGLKEEVFDKQDNIRPVNKHKRYDTYHYYLEKGSNEPEMSYMTTKRGFDDLDPKINEYLSHFKVPGRIPEAVQNKESITSFRKVDDGYYEGQYLNREKNGWGRLYVQTEDGYVYTEGCFRNNQLNGYALTIDQEGYCLITEYRNGVSEGYGACFRPYGSILWEGECLRDNLHGYGITYDETNAKCLRGFFENGEENGFGIQYLANNYVFERIPSSNNFKGKGKLISPDNNYFMGEFIGSVKNGYGEIHYETGFSFKGFFANDKRNGYGQTCDKEGNLEKYIYINDEKVQRL